MSNIPVTFCDTLGCNPPSGAELLHKVIERWERAEKERERRRPLLLFSLSIFLREIHQHTLHAS